MLTPPLFFLVLLVYAKARRGAQWDGMLLGAMFGVSLGGVGMIHNVLAQVNDAAFALGIDILTTIAQKIGGAKGGGVDGPSVTSVPAGVILRYHLGLLGIGA